MKIYNFIPFALLGLLVGCGSDTTETYKTDAIVNFVVSCTNQGQASMEQCSCIMDEVRNEISFDEFLEIDTIVATGGQPPEEFTKVLTKSRQACF